MAISEIEKLERRFAENPQGLTFAPLAEAYRKSGDPTRALGVLRPGLELHPDYIPASIVLGRCQLDLGSDPEAEAAFAHVLTLDPENVIALKAVADISERGGRFDDAAARLRLLLEVDRSNEEAQAQLDRVLAARQQYDDSADVTVVDESSLVTESFAGSFDLAADLDLEPVTAPSADAPEPVSEPDIPLPPAPFDMSMLELSPHLADSPMFREPTTVEDDVPAARDPDPIFGTLLPDEPEPEPLSEAPAAETHADSGEVVLESRDRSEFQIPSALDDLAPSTQSLAAEYQLPDASSELISLDTSSGASEFQTPDASSSLLEQLAREMPPKPVAETTSFAFMSADDSPPSVAEAPAIEDEPAGEWVTWSDAALDEDAPPFEPAEAQAEPEPIAEPVAASAPEPESVSAAEPEPVPFVEPEPVAVVEPEPEPDLVVTESMAELFVRQGHAGDALRIYRELATRRPGDARLVARISELETVEATSRPPSTPYAARVTGGISARDLMRSILAARPNGRTPSAPPTPTASPVDTTASRPTEPTRPAQDAISLSDVFGEEGSTLPPAYRPSRAPSPDKGVSFDEFFGAPTEPHASAARARGPRPPADDLDQFHAWLQNLKR